MKKHLTTLIVASSVAIHAQAADLETRLLGYWQPDLAKTLALAKQENREINPQTELILGRVMYTIHRDKMTMDGRPGKPGDAVPYTVKAVDKAANSLTLSVGGKEMKARFQEGRLALDVPDNGWIIFKRMNLQDLAKRRDAEAEILRKGREEAPPAVKLADVSAQPIPDKPAAGMVRGEEFKVGKATINRSCLSLGQGKGMSPDMGFTIFFRKDDNQIAGQKFTVKPNQERGRSIFMEYKVEGKNSSKTEIHNKNYTMSLEFGTAKDGRIPGRIHLRLPDEAGSFVVGNFEAEIEPEPRELADVSAQPIPDKPAAGKVHGEEFKVEEATLEGNTLELLQTVDGGKGFRINQNGFTIKFSKGTRPLDGKTFLIKPGERSDEVQQVELTYALEKGGIGVSYYLTGMYTMKVEFGTAKDGKIPGKIHLQLQDELESFVVGGFVAEIK